MPKINQKTAMRLLGVSDTKIRELVKDGELIPTLSGTQKMFEQSEVYRLAKKFAQEYRDKMK